MNLNDYKKYYVVDEGHWYVSKVKQYSKKSINEFAKGLLLFSKLLVGKPENKLLNQFDNYKPKEQPKLFEDKIKQITVNEVSKLFLSLQILTNDLVDLAHLATINPEKHKKFLELQKDFLEGKNYEHFIKRYTNYWLNAEFTVYYRNFETWLSKFGFYGKYENGIAYITDIGFEFLKSHNEKNLSSAIFLNQIKKIQVWNPTLPVKYKDFKVRPYYLILQILLKLPQNYFSKDEYVLFVTKVKNHKEECIKQAVDLICQFRELTPQQQTKYIESTITLDKKNCPKRDRTNFERLSDSYNKEISAYAFSNLTSVNEGEVKLSKINEAQKELVHFLKSGQFIIFESKYDWIRHLGTLNGLSIDDIVEIYVRSGKSQVDIKTILKDTEEQNLEEKIKDRFFEKEIEEFYEKNLYKIDENLRIVEEPDYGRQYPTHIGPIDILCMNIKTNEYVVLEFKRSQVSDDTIGQILRYMGWIYINLSPANKQVKGIIIGNDFSEKLHYSLSGVQSDHIYELVKLFNHPFTENNRPILQSLLKPNKRYVRNRER